MRFLGNEDDAVASRVRAADEKNLNLLPAPVERQAIPERLIRQARGLFVGATFWRCISASRSVR
jgi:hypothetical protein